jgi:hypothetical protein
MYACMYPQPLIEYKIFDMVVLVRARTLGTRPRIICKMLVEVRVTSAHKKCTAAYSNTHRPTNSECLPGTSPTNEVELLFFFQ